MSKKTKTFRERFYYNDNRIIEKKRKTERKLKSSFVKMLFVIEGLILLVLVYTFAIEGFNDLLQTGTFIIFFVGLFGTLSYWSITSPSNGTILSGCELRHKIKIRTGLGLPYSLIPKKITSTFVLCCL